MNILTTYMNLFDQKEKSKIVFIDLFSELFHTKKHFEQENKERSLGTISQRQTERKIL